MLNRYLRGLIDQSLELNMHYRLDYGEFYELLQLLENIDTRVRLRGLGDPWTRFSKVILLSESAVILQAEDEAKSILNIRNVIEFQVEKNIGKYQQGATYELEY